MKIISTVKEGKGIFPALTRSGEKIALVATMGALHAGHLSLIDIAKKQCAQVVVSIFVNPAQFNNREDLKKYPRDLDRDCKLLEEKKVDYLFAPTNQDEIYPAQYQNWIEPGALSKLYEGAARPGHFRGVVTIVSQLFNIVTPNFAIFGEKDFQQLRVVQQLVEDLKFPIKIIPAPIFREKSGLAMSSRNTRLSQAGLLLASNIYLALQKGRESFLSGEVRGEKIEESARTHLKLYHEIALDYLTLIDEETLLPSPQIMASVEDKKNKSHAHRLIAAATVEGVRLIDNLRLD
jgi:pantoate--beta-alanine ligase